MSIRLQMYFPISHLKFCGYLEGSYLGIPYVKGDLWPLEGPVIQVPTGPPSIVSH